MNKSVVMLGTFDTKAVEFSALRAKLTGHGLNVISIDCGIMPSKADFPVEYEAEAVALASGYTLEEMRNRGDRGEAIEHMREGVTLVVKELYDKGAISGIIGMGGGGGTTLSTSVMQHLPIGFPKLCISTLSSGNTIPYVGTRDIIMYPSIVDVCGINEISEKVMTMAVAAFNGMVEAYPPAPWKKTKRTIFLSMFGNTTPCGNECIRLLSERGFDVTVFHTTGIGGRIMEDMINDGYADAVLDLTLTEWADQVCGGIEAAGEHRLEAAGKQGIPQLVIPGCVDMVNFGPPETVPQRYQTGDRVFYSWDPFVTLMRTNISENIAIAGAIASRVNQSKGPVACLLPMGGLSKMDVPGQTFYDPKADTVLFEELIKKIDDKIRVKKSVFPINDKRFAAKAVEMLLALIDEAD